MSTESRQPLPPQPKHIWSTRRAVFSADVQRDELAVKNTVGVIWGKEGAEKAIELYVALNISFGVV
jgi:hypothetical protein